MKRALLQPSEVGLNLATCVRIRFRRQCGVDGLRVDGGDNISDSYTLLFCQPNCSKLAIQSADDNMSSARFEVDSELLAVIKAGMDGVNAQERVIPSDIYDRTWVL